MCVWVWLVRAVCMAGQACVHVAEGLCEWVVCLGKSASGRLGLCVSLARARGMSHKARAVPVGLCARDMPGLCSCMEAGDVCIRLAARGCVTVCGSPAKAVCDGVVCMWLSGAVCVRLAQAV